MKIAVIGGGAAGFFSAISVKTHHPKARVIIFEKTKKLLSKVKISGGGRCNVTHHCFEVNELVKFYPRGGKSIRKAFNIFSTKDTIKWFEERGVALKTESDGRMFPVTNSSQTIIDCLMNEISKLGIIIKTETPIKKISQEGIGYTLYFNGKERFGIKSDQYFDKVIVATGGTPRKEGFEWLSELSNTIKEPVPSLFTFNMPNEKIVELMGVVVDPVTVKIMGTKFKSKGPLLVTHWGMSGPAILKLSAFGARILNEKQYQFKLLVSWIGDQNEKNVRLSLDKTVDDYPKKKVQNLNPFNLPGRLWIFLLKKLGIPEDMIWKNLGRKNMNRIVHTLLNDEYEVSGKTTFKEEFVTCGGISLQDIDIKTMQSKRYSSLYFAGEILDIDGITGGFNFQNAWTSGFIAGKLE
jgi:predicted Rossmann fold flavoprotein